MEFEQQLTILTRLMGEFARGVDSEENLKLSVVIAVLVGVLGEDYEEACLELENSLSDPAFKSEVHLLANRIHNSVTGEMSANFVARYVLGTLQSRHGIEAIKALPRFPREAPGDIPPKANFVDDLTTSSVTS